MADLDFFIDVVVSGAVLGVGLSESPHDVTCTLGSDYLEDRSHGRMRRDYGLVEFFWERRSESDPWLATGFTVQTHRLESVEVAEELIRRYGLLDRQLRFAQLNAELERLGYRLEEITGNTDLDYRQYWLAESRISVVTTGSCGESMDTGSVWSISAPHPPEAVVAVRLGAKRQAIKDGLAHLLRLGDHERQRWLDRRQPEPSGRVNWWLYLLLVVDSYLSDRPRRRPDWVELRLWLLDQGRVRRVFTQAEFAEKLAYFVVGMRSKGVELALLPSADDVVRACLDAIPVGLDRIVMLDDRRDLRKLDITQMRQSSKAKQLVRAAQLHLDGVQDERLAGELRKWIDVKPRLV
ncbi:hypothetical protein [Acrocarpospora catenulata]|uniref:hypothetical protein n=1 Tax=Acrocarpospora catenulata TaxID=2836182 RepID=UPI001BDB603F|nr:hypothetical protein [Acrocarpospora catenulata]